LSSFDSLGVKKSAVNEQQGCTCSGCRTATDVMALVEKLRVFVAAAGDNVG